jgi:hypothetical protein
MRVRRHGFLRAIGGFAAGCACVPSPVFGQQLLNNGDAIDLGNQGALYRVRIDGGDFDSVFCTAGVLPRSSFRARVLEQRDRSTAQTAVRTLAQACGATVAINGGYFNGAFAPDGLLIVDGKTIGRRRGDWMGLLTIDEHGNASVGTDTDLRGVQYAVQGYPMLVEPGGRMGIEREDHEQSRRTVIAQSGDVILAMVTSAVSLFNLAYALIERPEAFYLHSIDAAMNLSGAATTSLYAKTPDRGEVYIPALWPNRDVIVFIAR